MSLIKEAENLFGNMRDTTPEEQKNINSHLKEISMPTGMNIFDLLNKENEVVDCHYCGHAMCSVEMKIAKLIAMLMTLNILIIMLKIVVKLKTAAGFIFVIRFRSVERFVL